MTSVAFDAEGLEGGAPPGLSPKSFPAGVIFSYLGRRGVMSRFALELMRAAWGHPDVKTSVCVSRQNENFARFAEFGSDVVGVNTFSHSSGAVLAAWRIPLLRKCLAIEIRRRRVGAVIELMPHVWSPFLVSVIHAAGARYITIAHDAVAHPGDATGLVNKVLDMALVRADRVITLSETITAQLQAGGRLPLDKIATLFLPDLTYDSPIPRRPRELDAPLRLLFLGRIMPYKGLNLFAEAIDLLLKSGSRVEVGVFGEGVLGPAGTKLKALKAEVVNRWLSEDEIASILCRYDVMVVSHVEASQSGVIATAFGAGLPVIATPVGALPEQVENGVTGLVADAVSAEALAVAAKRLALDPRLYSTLCDGVRARRDTRSMQRFVRECVRIARE